MISAHDIVGTVVAGFGADLDGPPTARWVPDGSRGVGILRASDCPFGGVTSWGTVEASAFATPYNTPDGRGVRVEFVAAVDGALSLFGDCVAACAFEIAPENDARPGTVYRDAVSNRYPEATTPHLYSVAPFVWGAAFAQRDDDEVHVTWLQLVPITEDEAKLVQERGPQALEDAFMRAQPDLFAIDRVSVLAGASGHDNDRSA